MWMQNQLICKDKMILIESNYLPGKDCCTYAHFLLMHLDFGFSREFPANGTSNVVNYRKEKMLFAFFFHLKSRHFVQCGISWENNKK